MPPVDAVPRLEGVALAKAPGGGVDLDLALCDAANDLVTRGLGDGR